jgi:hypothetical protein
LGLSILLGPAAQNEATRRLIAKIEKRIAEYCNRPASGALAALVFIEVSVAPDAEPVNLTVVGKAKIGEQEVSHDGVPAEDRMQAFLWRHLVPATELKALVFNPTAPPPPKRVPRARPPVAPDTNATVVATNAVPGKPKFTKQQVAGRLRELKLFFEEELLTDDFYDLKVAEREAAR